MIIGIDDLADPITATAADVTIVGAGPSGLALARGLSELGRSVLVLDAGPDVAGNGTSLNDGEVGGAAFTGFEERGIGLGGGSSRWAAQCYRFHPLDFERREWVPDSGWPIRYEDLLPYYALAERFVGISADGYFYRGLDRRAEAEMAVVGETAPIWCSVYGAHPQLFERDRAEWARSTRVTLVHDAQVVGIARAGGAVSGVTVAGSSGTSVTIPVTRLVLAAGAIETARLLLDPGADFAGGVGDGSAHVGAHFQDHPNAVVGRVRWTGGGDVGRDLVRLFSLAKPAGARRLPRMTIPRHEQEARSLMNACAFLFFDWDATSVNSGLRSLRAATVGRTDRNRLLPTAAGLLRKPGLLADAVPAVLERRPILEPPAAAYLHVFAEQEPGGPSRVVLGSRRDRHGRRLARVEWTISDTDRRTVSAMTAQSGAALATIGYRVEPIAAEELGWRDSQHHAGTARMADSPRHGVVDAEGLVFGLQNLWVTGGAVMPTSSYGNPTLTMMALAFRLSRHLSVTAF